MLFVFFFLQLRAAPTHNLFLESIFNILDFELNRVLAMDRGNRTNFDIYCILPCFFSSSFESHFFLYVVYV